MIEQFGPDYTITSATLKKFRSNARKGLSDLSREERQAYGAAVEAAVLSAQRAALRRTATPVRSFYPVGEALRRAHRNRLQAAVAKERKDRTPAQWQAMYDEAMRAKRARVTLAKAA